MNFYKRYLGDYARDTAHLSLIEHGAYQVLLDTYYATGTLAADKDELYRIARAMNAAERKAVLRVADEFFPINGDGTRHNKRADAELANAHAYAEKQAERANMRWHKQPDKQMDKPDACRTDASHSHSQKNLKRGASRRSPKTSCPPEFEVTEEMADWAESKGLPADRVMSESEKFMAHHRAKDSHFSDWHQAWQSWIFKAVEFGKFKPPIPRETVAAPKPVLQAAPAAPVAALKPDALPPDFIVDFLNDWSHRLGVTQGADESETEFYAAVVSAVEVEAKTGNAEAAEWLEQYGEQARSMVPA